MREEIFRSYPVPKALQALAIPAMCAMLGTVFYNIADTFFVGQTGDSNQVAAVSVTFPLFVVLTATGNIFGLGGSSYIARLLGKGDRETVKKVSAFCVYGSIAAGILYAAIVLFFMDALLELIGAQGEMAAHAAAYLRCVGLGSVFVILQNAICNLLRAEGAAKTAMRGMLLGNIANILLDPVMILWLDMGVAGAALATVLGNVLGVGYYLVKLRCGDTLLSLKTQDVSFGHSIPREVLTNGIPAAMNNILMSVSFIILNRYLLPFGSEAQAAAGIANRLTSVMVFLIMGLSSGMQPFFGYNYSAGNPERMKQGIRLSFIVTCAMGTVYTAVTSLLSDPLIRLFIQDEQVVTYGKTLYVGLVCFCPVIGILFVTMSAFQAVGRPGPAMFLSASRQGFIFIPAIVLGSMLFGFTGIAFSTGIAGIAASAIAWIFYKKLLFR